VTAKQRNFKESIRHLFFLYAFLPIIILFGLFLIFTRVNAHLVLANQTQEANGNIAEAITGVYNNYNEEIERVAYLPVVLRFAKTQQDSRQVYEEFYRFNTKQRVKSVFHIVDTRGEMLASSLAADFYIDKQLVQDILSRISNLQGGTLAETNHFQYSRDLYTVYTFGKEILDQGVPVGYVIYQLYEEDVQKLIFVPNNEIAVITDQHNRIIVTNNNTTRGIMNKFNPQIGRMGYLTLNEGEYYTSRSDLAASKMHVYTLNSVQYLKYAYTTLSIFIVITGLLLWVVIHFLARKMSTRNSQSIDKLLHAVGELQQGNMLSYVEIKTGDEFETLAEQYNIMLNRLNELLSKNEELSNIRRIIEVKQLQSQFHPHFIFNVLETLRYSIMIDTRKAQDIVMILSRLLRYSVNNDGQNMLLREDLGHVADYLKLQQIRFSDRLTYAVKVSEEAGDALVPKLLLQAIIENSIKYGYRHRNSLIISITGHVEDGRLVLEVRDNGYGIESDRLQEIREIMCSTDNRSRHIGLNNVHRRLVLLYGEEYGVSIDSELGSGTNVSIVIPYEKGDAHV
jgi:two-component system sensor histidine kinase YesM